MLAEFQTASQRKSLRIRVLRRDGWVDAPSARNNFHRRLRSLPAEAHPRYVVSIPLRLGQGILAQTDKNEGGLFAVLVFFRFPADPDKSGLLGRKEKGPFGKRSAGEGRREV